MRRDDVLQFKLVFFCGQTKSASVQRQKVAMKLKYDIHLLLNKYVVIYDPSIYNKSLAGTGTISNAVRQSEVSLAKQTW